MPALYVALLITSPFILFSIADQVAFIIAGYRWYKSGLPWEHWTALGAWRFLPWGGFAQLRRYPRPFHPTPDSMR